MWNCVRCREVCEDQFDACWNCGASRDGQLNPEFQREPQPNGDGSSLEEQFASNYVCQKCQHPEARVERISATGTNFMLLLQRKDFVAVACEQCGFTELYSLSALEERTRLGEFFSSLFWQR